MKFSVFWRTVVGWGGGVLLTLILLPPGLIALALDPVKQRLVTPFVHFWAVTIIRLICVPVRVLGLENLDGVEAAVLAANHQSLMDIFLVLGFVPRRVIFLAKKQIKWIPLFGLLILMLGHILVDRSNPKRSLRSVEKCMRAVRAGRSILIFPEGTRTSDGSINRFKSGSLRIPLRTGAKVVPLTICGTFNMMPKGTFAVRPFPLLLHIGEPMETAALDQKNWKGFVAELEGVISRTKERLEREYPDVAPLPGATETESENQPPPTI